MGLSEIGNKPAWQPQAAPAPAAAKPAPVAQPSPYTSGPGITSGVAQPQLASLSQAGPGQGETAYTQNANAYSSPSFGEVNNQGLVGQYSDPNSHPQVSNNAQDWYSQYANSMPSIASDPGLDPYYNNAEKRSTEAINQAVAARGAYGSSAANDQISRGITDLEADKAKNEANYNLQRLGEQRAWQGLGGQLAGQADQGSSAQSQDLQAWTSLLSKMGMDASQLGLNRTNAGMDAAGNAQNLTRQRGQDYFNNQLAQGDRMADLVKFFMGPALANDAASMENASSGGVAEGNQAASNEANNAANTTELLKTGAQIYGGIKP